MVTMLPSLPTVPQVCRLNVFVKILSSPVGLYSNDKITVVTDHAVILQSPLVGEIFVAL